jgi:hypothetical protein
MTTRQPDLDRLLRAFLAEGPLEVPDRALETALDAVAATTQRRDLVIRRFTMTPTMRLLIAAALALAVGAGALVAFSGKLGPSQSPSPAPSASLAPSVAAPASAGPSPVASVAATSPLLGAGVKAVNRVDAAANALQAAGQLNANDAGRIVAAADGVRLSLGDGSLELARSGYAALPTLVADKAGSLSGPLVDELRDATTALGNALNAGPLTVGTLASGSYRSGTFTRPLVVLAIPDGWSRFLDDPEVFALQQGKTVFAIHHAARETSAPGVAAAIGGTPPYTLPPTAVTIGLLSGLEAQAPAGATLFYTAGLQAFDPAAGDVVRIWVLDLGGKPLTIELIGQPADVAALLPEVERMVRTMVVYDVPTG